jgi:hypothetical protein
LSVATQPLGTESRSEPATISAEDLSFADRNLEKSFRSLHEAASKLAGSKWQHSPLSSIQHRGYPTTYSVQWQSKETFVPLKQTRERIYRSARRMVIQLRSKDISRPREIHGLTFEAARESNSDWGVMLRYDTQAGNETDAFQASLYHAEYDSADLFLSDFIFTFPMMKYRGSLKADGNEYHLNLIANALFPSAASRPAEVTQRWYESPEQLKAHALAEVERLREEARRCIELNAIEFTNWAATRSAEPARRLPVSAPVAADVKAKLLTDAEKELDRRKKVIEQQYEGMHAALLATFPLDFAIVERDALR